MLVRLLYSAVAPPTGVAGSLADLIEVRPDEGVSRPELVEARGHRFASCGRRRVWPHPLPWSVRVVRPEQDGLPIRRLDPSPSALTPNLIRDCI